MQKSNGTILLMLGLVLFFVSSLLSSCTSISGTSLRSNNLDSNTDTSNHFADTVYGPAYHSIQDNFHLGNLIDAEKTAEDNLQRDFLITQTGSILTDDGIVIKTTNDLWSSLQQQTLIKNQSYQFKITTTMGDQQQGRLTIWIADEDSHVIVPLSSVVIGSKTTDISLTIPENISGKAFIRVRLYPQSPDDEFFIAPTYSGTSVGGEVEDYLVFIQ